MLTITILVFPYVQSYIMNRKTGRYLSHISDHLRNTENVPKINSSNSPVDLSKNCETSDTKSDKNVAEKWCTDVADYTCCAPFWSQSRDKQPPQVQTVSGFNAVIAKEPETVTKASGALSTPTEKTRFAVSTSSAVIAEEPETVTKASLSTPAVKIRTESQQARLRRKFQKLKEKKKARKQLASQEYRLANQPAPTLYLEATGLQEQLTKAAE